MRDFKKVFSHLKPYKLLIVLSVLCMAVEVAANVLQPKYMEQIVDVGILEMNMDTVIHAGLIMLAVALIGGIGGYISCIFSNIYSQRFGNDLRKGLFKKIMQLSAQQDDACTVGSLITRMTNDTRVVTEFSSVVIQMVVKPLLLFFFGIAMILSIDYVYAVILIISLPVQFLIMRFFIKKSAPFFKNIQDKTDKLNLSAMHIVSNNRLIKSYSRERYEVSKFNEQNVDLTDTMLKVQLLMSLLNPLVMFILNGVVVAVIYIGGFQVQANAIQVGSIMAAINYSQQIMMSMMTFGGVFQHISRSKISAQRLAELMDNEPAIQSGDQKLPQCTNTISFRNVSFRYPQHKDAKLPVLDNISFDIHNGASIGILGTTGSGKSTLARLLSREYDVDEGSITFDGVDIRDLDLTDLREKVTVVFQSSDLFQRTIKENITCANKDHTEEEFEKAVHCACVDEFAPNLQSGYDTLVAERGFSVSGGQKQRIAIARALLRNSQFLIFDDSTSSLDQETERTVLTRIKENYANKTKIIISQRISSVIDTDMIILIRNGRIDSIGSHETLMKESQLYQTMYETQNLEGGAHHE